MTQDELKQAVARAAIDYVVDGEIIGVGTGSTANFFIDELAKIKDRIKGAVASLTRSLAIDWAAEGVRVNAVCPGFTRTPMATGQMSPELEAAVNRRVPLGRIFEPEEIAASILFLASDLASAVTGVILPVDGGWTAGEPALPM